MKLGFHWLCLCWTVLHGNKLVYFPFKWYRICKENIFVGSPRACCSLHIGGLVTNIGWRMGCHPTAACDQAGDQHEEKVPGSCACVWFFHMLLRPLANSSWVKPTYWTLLLSHKCIFPINVAPFTRWHKQAFQQDEIYAKNRCLNKHNFSLWIKPEMLICLLWIHINCQ